MISSGSGYALRSAVEAAHAAGAIVLRGLAIPDKRTRTKGHPRDPVTIYDREAEAAIVRILAARHPNDGILSEESTCVGGSSGRRWIVDPLDGTSNFVAGIPHFAVSIALADEVGILVGCVHDPARGESFTAARGGGAWLNGKRIHASDRGTIDGASIGVGLSYDSNCRARLIDELRPFLSRAGVLRTLGSAALDLAYVAAGRFDVVWYLALHAWDVAAGGLLVEESGGRVTDLGGSRMCDPAHGLIASNGRIHDEFVHELQ